MPTYGQRPDDVVTDSRGNAQPGVLLKLYTTQALAEAGGTPLGTATTGYDGTWSYETDELDLYARTPNGRVWQVAQSVEEMVAAAEASATASAESATLAQDALNAASSAQSAAEAASSSAASSAAAVANKVSKGELRVNVKDYGAVGDGTTDDTTAMTDAIADAIALKRELWVPDGTYLVEAPLLISGATDFRADFEGRVKRKDASVRNSLVYFLNCTGLRAKSIRTNGNVLNNQLAQSDTIVYPVDEAKHDVRLEGCTDVEIGLIDSVDPAGDTLYVTGSTTRVKIGTVRSYSAQSSGRNAVSIVSGSKIDFDAVLSFGTGCSTGVIAMPGGFDIEPNSGQSVSDITVGRLQVEANSTSGVTIYGAYTSGGIRQIKRVKIGEATLVKTAGVKTASCDIPIRGVDDLFIGRLTHSTDATNANQAFSIDDASLLDINIDVARSGGTTPPNIGATATVDKLTLRGRIGASGSHCLQVYNLTNSLIDMTLKNPPNGSMLISKNATGTSSNVRFRGDWRKDATGSWAMNIAGAVTDWRLDGVDMTGWPGGGRLMNSANAQSVERFNVKGLTYGTAAPTTDWWGVGHYVENTNPAEAGGAGSKYITRGWICTVAGNPGTWLPVRTLTGN